MVIWTQYPDLCPDTASYKGLSSLRGV